MILFMILLITAMILGVVAILVVSIVGAGGIILFGDVIVCIVLISWLIKLFRRKK